MIKEPGGTYKEKGAKVAEAESKGPLFRTRV